MLYYDQILRAQYENKLLKLFCHESNIFCAKFFTRNAIKLIYLDSLEESDAIVKKIVKKLQKNMLKKLWIKVTLLCWSVLQIWEAQNFKNELDTVWGLESFFGFQSDLKDIFNL